MRFGYIVLSVLAAATQARPELQVPLTHNDHSNNTISTKLFAELEELARIVDISYCVGVPGSGISKPFNCLGRCSDFKTFELVTTFSTGMLSGDSCGYIALSHPPAPRRLIVAFRGTYSLTNTIADLSTIPQEYIPYPGDDDDGKSSEESFGSGLSREHNTETPPAKPPKCDNCTVHSGFYSSWLNTRRAILPDITEALRKYPDYTLTLVGHSLGGAIAALASLDLKARGWDPHVTTFGEPRVGNKAFNRYIDERFNLPQNSSIVPNSTFRRVTHKDDPVPLLPLEEWGYHMHAGEIFISKKSLQPSVEDLWHCVGDEDHNCIAGSDDPNSVDSEDLQQLKSLLEHHSAQEVESSSYDQWTKEATLLNSESSNNWPIPSRYRLWELFFAHRDYFWRIGLCIPGGDPWDWFRKYPHYEDVAWDEL